MSVEEKTKAETATDPKATPATAPAQDSGKLAGLMAEGQKGKAGAPAPTGPDLEIQALKAAEAAIAHSQQALAEARTQLQQKGRPKGSRGRELALRALLLVNLAAMVAVMLVPSGTPTQTHAPAPTDTHGQPQPATLRLDGPYERALAAADQGEWRTAIAILEGYLQASPRLAPARRANVLFALEHYAHQLGDFKATEEYRRKAEALRSSASLPDDLVQMAREAETAGDAESVRRLWARFLLQQRQIPSSLYKHIAEAYLKLGDSYKTEAQQAADRARRQELEDARNQLRDEARANPEAKK